MARLGLSLVASWLPRVRCTSISSGPTQRLAVEAGVVGLASAAAANQPCAVGWSLVRAPFGFAWFGENYFRGVDIVFFGKMVTPSSPFESPAVTDSSPFDTKT